MHQASGQNFSVGATVGTNLTQDFVKQYVAFPPPYTGFLITSQSESFIGGPSLEWRLPAGFSIETDALYRSLHAKSPSPISVITWEFPMLAKYRFAAPVVKPFVEAGPSFRSAGNLNATSPSHHGVTAGFGVEGRLGWLSIAPELRYTRWAKDTQYASPLTKPDQLELLVDFSANSGSDRHPFGRLVSFGVVLGATLTDDFRATSYSFTAISYSANGIAELNGTSYNFSGPKSFLIGPMLEFHLPQHFSVELDGIRRPLRPADKSVLSTGSVVVSESGTFMSWEFPVLGKYEFSAPFERHFVKPFVEAGPSFRLPLQLSGGNLSTHGVTAGAGLAFQLKAFKISPGVRYTYWGIDNPSGWSNTLHNEVQFLAGVSF